MLLEHAHSHGSHSVYFLCKETETSIELHVHSHKHSDRDNAPSSISLIGNRFQKATKNSLASTLAGESGLSVRSFGQATERPILRGYSGDRFLITRDGTELGDLSSTTADHAVATEISSMDGVEIIRGPESLLYGSNAIAGVINLSPLASNEEKIKNPEYKSIFGHETSNKSNIAYLGICLLYTSPSPRDKRQSRMPSSA